MNAVQPGTSLSWREVISVYSRPRVIAMSFLGFAGGLPFLLVFSTLTAWLSEAQVSRTTIGFFAWVGITYSVKVFWAPVVDRLRLPLLGRLGRRRSWILLGQMGIVTGLLGMAMVGPDQLMYLSLFAVLVAFSSATQDIAIDAYRIEAVEEIYQGAMSATYIFGYRVALLMAGAGAFYLAEYLGWVLAYQCMALLMGVGVITVLLIREPSPGGAENPQANDEQAIHRRLEHLPWLPVGARRLLVWLSAAVLAPFVDFFRRNGRFGLLVLLFISVFRLSDIAMGIMANPFYLDRGYCKTDIANIAKLFGFFMTIAGSAICGVLVVKWGILRPLLAGAVLVASTNLLFALLSTLQPELHWLALVISADNISGGFAATAFVAYLSSLTNRAYTATQYALFSSLMTLPGKFISGFSGMIVDGAGYMNFFLFASAIGLPAILLVTYMIHRDRRGGLSPAAVVSD